MSETALTMAELEIKILRQLKEDTSGSEAFPSALIYDTANEIYEEVFNQPNKQIKVRTDEYEFETVEDDALDGALSIADTSIVLDDSSSFPSSGRILIGNEFIDYSANDGATTLTCSASDILQDHADGETVRCVYAVPSAMDKEKVQYLNINGLPYDIVDIGEILDDYRANARNFAIHDGYLILPANSDSLPATMYYTPVIARMTTGTDTPALIPNNFRVPLIVNGSVGRLMMLDGQRGYELYYRPSGQKGDKGGGLFYKALREFYASYGRQSDMRDKRTSRSIYDNN